MKSAIIMSAFMFVAVTSVANSAPVTVYLPPDLQVQPSDVIDGLPDDVSLPPEIAAPSAPNAIDGKVVDPSIKIAHPIDVYIPPPDDHDADISIAFSLPVDVYLPSERWPSNDGGIATET